MIATDTSCTKSVTGVSGFKTAVPALGDCQFVVSEEAFYEESFGVSGCSHSISNNRAVATSGKLDHSLRTELQEAVNRELLKEIFNSIFRSQRKGDDGSMRKLAELVASCSQQLQTKTSQLMTQLEAVEAQREILAVHQRQLAVTNKEVDTVCSNQSRLRDNLERLKEHSSSVVVRRYLEDMNRDEDTLLAARKKITELEETEVALKKTIAAAESTVRDTANDLLKLC